MFRLIKQLVISLLFVKDFVTTKLGLNNNSSTDTYNNTGGLSANDIVNKNIRDLIIKFGIENIPTEHNRLLTI